MNLNFLAGGSLGVQSFSDSDFRIDHIHLPLCARDGFHFVNVSRKHLLKSRITGAILYTSIDGEIPEDPTVSTDFNIENCKINSSLTE